MKLLNMSLCAAMLIIAVIIIRSLCLHKLPKRTFIVLWGIVLLRLLLPFELPAAWLPFELPEFQSGLGEVLITRNEDNVLFDTQLADWQLQPLQGADIASFPWEMLVYLAGALACAGFFIIAHCRFLGRCADSLPLEERPKIPVRINRKISLRCSDKISLPFSYGIIKPTVLLPKTLLHEENAQQKIVLLHEFMHIRHHDILLKYLLAAALCMHWFNPLVWAMYILANRDIELACDEAVLKAFGHKNRAAYAMALINLEEHKAGFAPLCSGFNKNAIEERIKAIMKTTKISRTGKLLAAMLVLMLLLATATSAIAQSPAKENIQQPAVEQNDVPQQSVDQAVITEPIEMICPLLNAKLTGSFCVRLHPITKEELLFDHITLSSANDNIFAAADGVVKELGYMAEKGNTLLIEHGNGIVTAYTHCSSFAVEVGDTVKQGDIIAKVGATGMATGDCLGFYVFENGIACDPLNYFEITE